MTEQRRNLIFLGFSIRSSERHRGSRVPCSSIDFYFSTPALQRNYLQVDSIAEACNAADTHAKCISPIDFYPNPRIYDRNRIRAERGRSPRLPRIILPLFIFSWHEKIEEMEVRQKRGAQNERAKGGWWTLHGRSPRFLERNKKVCEKKKVGKYSRRWCPTDFPGAVIPFSSAVPAVPGSFVIQRRSKL